MRVPGFDGALLMATDGKFTDKERLLSLLNMPAGGVGSADMDKKFKVMKEERSNWIKKNAKFSQKNKNRDKEEEK